MSLIASTFKQLSDNRRKALIPFITAGDPDIETTLTLMNTLVENGADIIELGVPFSDPMADGPTIQRASERALGNGTSLFDVMALVKKFRANNDVTPVVLMGYANPIESMGVKNFVSKSKEAGVDGVLVVDYPPEESEELTNELRKNEIDSIFLLAPTSLESRIKAVGALASGYVYYVSLKGVTGSANIDLEDVTKRVNLIKKHVAIPVGVGFGIRDGETARAVADLSDAVVIGSRLVEHIESSNSKDVVTNVENFIRSVRVALDKDC